VRVINITAAGLNAIRNDTTMQPEDRLLVEIMARVYDVERSHLISLYNELLSKFVSIDDAIIAIKSGEVSFEKVGQYDDNDE